MHCLREGRFGTLRARPWNAPGQASAPATRRLSALQLGAPETGNAPGSQGGNVRRECRVIRSGPVKIR
jgi:hypothetical protein